MKKNVWTFGLIAGAICTLWMIIFTTISIKEHFDHGMIYGYTMMIMAFAFIFVAVKNYRDKFNNGAVSFGKAFLIGLYITLIASTFYVVTWLIDFYYFIPDFMEDYTACVMEKLKAGGASAAELQEKTTEMASFKEMYKNPFFNAAVTYIEILPVGLLISLISAAILKRKPVKV